MDALGLLPSRRALYRRPRRRVATTLRRQPILFWACALVASTATFVVVLSSLRATADGAETYGSLVSVAVARVDLEPGEVITDAHVEVARLPADLVPAGAVAAAPTGTAVRHRIVAGEAVVSDRLAPDGAVGIAAMLLEGERAVAVPLPAHRVPLQPGQTVDVLATTDPTFNGGRAATTVAASGAVVLSVDEGGITVAVDEAAAARIATAMATAVVTVAVSG